MYKKILFSGINGDKYFNITVENIIAIQIAEVLFRQKMASVHMFSITNVYQPNMNLSLSTCIKIISSALTNRFRR